MAVSPQFFSLPSPLASDVEATMGEWLARENVGRLWAQDASLWTGSDEGDWLGWLNVVSIQLENLESLYRISEEVRREGFTHALLLGMGGSSLCAEVLASTFGAIESYPEFRVLDSTDPAQVRAVENAVDLARTVIIVSSKSGTTLESSILYEYFFDRLSQVTSPTDAALRTIAITDPGSPLEALSRQRGVGHVFLAPADVGGRFSALSEFGMVPAAVMGLDLARLLGRAQEMVAACGPEVGPGRNPGVSLGIVLGCLARAGRDKMTILAPRTLAAMGAWLDQLVAESTGKDGRGIVPVDMEPVGPVDAYGSDRFFVSLSQASSANEDYKQHLDALREAGHPVITIELADAHDIGQEFFRWEMATAVAGSLIGVNPFLQPDVETSKSATRRMMSEFEKSGALAGPNCAYEAEGLQLFAGKALFSQLQGRVPVPSLGAYMGAFFSYLDSGAYLGIQAYLEMNSFHESLLQRLREVVRDQTGAATSLGFGPRFLHSTGQMHKGGPQNGVFLQITCADAEDIPVPGKVYSFGVVKAAQAAGDMEVLASRGRPILRVHIGPDVRGGLEALNQAVIDGLEDGFEPKTS